MKRIIDDRGRIFGFLSVIDVFVVIVAAVLVIAVLYRTGNGGSHSPTVGTVPVTYTVMISNIRETSAKLFRPGDKLYTKDSIYIGTISNADIEDAWITTQLVDGSFVKARSHDRYIVTLTVETQCSVANGSYYADKTYELCANTEQQLVTKYVNTTGLITEIMVD